MFMTSLHPIGYNPRRHGKANDSGASKSAHWLDEPMTSGKTGEDEDKMAGDVKAWPMNIYFGWKSLRWKIAPCSFSHVKHINWSQKILYYDDIYALAEYELYQLYLLF